MNNNEYNNQNNYPNNFNNQNNPSNQINQNNYPNNFNNQNIVPSDLNNNQPLSEQNEINDDQITAKDVVSGIFTSYLARHGAIWGFSLLFLGVMAILLSGLTQNAHAVQLISILVIIVGIILIIIGVIAKAKHIEMLHTNPFVKTKHKVEVIMMIVGVILALIQILIENLKK